MSTPTYVSPFTGTVVTQTQVSYLNLPFSANTQLYWPSNTPTLGNSLPRILDAQASSAGLSLTFPPANEGTVGADCLVRNTGTNAFTVYNNDQSQSQTIQPGQGWYFYLTNNTTVGGTWAQLQFGTGTSTADANTLAGGGLVVNNGKLQLGQTVIDIATQPLLTNESSTKTYNWTSGNGTFLLPPVSSLSPGWFINFRNNGNGNLLLQPQGIATINGSANVTTNPGDSGTIILDGTGATANFITVGLSAPITSAFTSSTYDVDAIPTNTLSLTSFAPIIQTYVALSGVRTASLNVVLPAITQVYILVNNTSNGYNLSFNVTGSSSPPVILQNGTIATVLSDGNTLYVISSTVTGTFYANNGTAAAPAFTFNSDTTTGLYLVGTGVLGLSAYGLDMLNIDNSVSGSPVVNSLVRFNASIISGGSF